MPVFPDHILTILKAQKSLAVALSGGPDSMALAHALHALGFKLHLLTVDHGLRDESADEAKSVGAWVRGWKGCTHHILRWQGQKAASRIQENARAARYGLMAEYCRMHGIAHLCLAHHRDDQAETVLLRLAAGSGLDGLAGMRDMQVMDGLTLVRPFLSVPKSDLIAYCRMHDLSYVEDPSNVADKFARVRLRHAREILEREGLSSKRLSLSAQRLARGRDALEFYAEQVYNDTLQNKNTKRIVLKKSLLLQAPEDIVFRVLEKVFFDLAGEGDFYGPRMERMETILHDLLRPGAFRKRTLGGAVISVDTKNDAIVFEKEIKPKRP